MAEGMEPEAYYEACRKFMCYILLTGIAVSAFLSEGEDPVLSPVL